ncbi:Protein of unknown function [Azotobacter beijerinckii]|uniref:DUF1654 domain-containing protein n=1 Tax=Azotobacter beijerinckii TaxID=170623 RepID=A0A1H6Z7J4_9GAMM|nr:DUF1654 domain-containing protein [Azotobacter beijerinckii]SEJ47357.1 Protein of unknown function [Azotobacter beijerinckii]
MAKPSKKTEARQPSSYELMGGRIQKIINSPKAQRARDVTIHRLPDESATDWARFLEEVAEAENVRVQHIEGDGVRLTWTVSAD